MREIEFRGKRLDTGEWVYGYYRCIAWNFDSPTHQIINGNTFYGVDPATVGQYTGLRDKKCKKIYEGDILDGSYINPMTEKKITRLYRAEFCRGNFYARLIGKSPYGDTMLYFQNERCEIIGNIHDNPELSGIDLTEFDNHEYFPTIPSQSQWAGLKARGYII
jgi:uncharacterized phage protein (TIGR01671 family)